MRTVLRLIVSLLLIIISSFGIYAQDSIYTVNGEYFKSKVQSIDKNLIHINPIERDSSTIKSFPRNYVTKIVFSDDYIVEFTKDGEIVRDKLLEAPVFKAKGSRIYAEGVVPLNEEETSQYFGVDRYYLSFKPERARYLTGMMQLFTGGAGIGLCAFLETPISFELNKDIWYRTYEKSIVFHGLSIQRTTPLNVKDRVIFSGHLVPYMVTAEFFTTTTLISGITNIITSSSALKKINTRNNKPAPTLTSTKVQYWTSIGLTVVGAGALIGGYLDLNTHKDWYIEHNPDPRYERHTGDAPIAGPILAIAGSVLMNIGVTEFTVASTRLKGYSKIGNNTPLALACGPTTSGYGMTLTF